MSSIIEGYNYDIFISYRQKDNKHDGWVTEFVDNLKGELDSTFKEEISVYFDINPHDGLLETHDVDASLKDKLRCLVFIPIISRTYCDPKSFAWEHEFKAFVEQASQDQIGLKVKLPNGNVANRVLPVRIHELDVTDIKQCESLIGGALRGIDFIYKAAGVNRPLRLNEDHPQDNLNKTFYRDQINKVANAVKEIITTTIKHNQKDEELSRIIINTKYKSPKKLKPKIIIASFFLFVLITLGYFFIPRLFNPPEKVEKSIAVLPFKLLSNELDKQYLADGMMDAILLHLQKFKDLRVMSRTSVEQYRGTTKTTHAIGQELAVEYLLEGSFQKNGDDVMLIVNLIKAREESHVWANEYNRNWKDIFPVQSEVAEAIATELKVMITPEEKHLIEKTPTTNMIAYNYYLRGNDYYWRNYDKQNFEIAAKMYEKAIESDPAFALAYVRLSQCYLRLNWFHYDKNIDRLTKSKEAIDAAFRIDPDLPEAHIALGSYFYTGFLEYTKALEQVNIAEEKLRNNTECIYLKANIYRRAGEWSLSKENYLKALDLNPSSSEIVMNTASTLTLLGDYLEAEKYFKKAILLNPTFIEAIWQKSFMYMKWKGNTVQSRETLLEAYQFKECVSHPLLFESDVLMDIYDGNYQKALSYLSSKDIDFIFIQHYVNLKSLLYARVYDLMRMPDKANEYFESARIKLDSMIQINPEDPRFYSAIGITYAGLGQKEKAIEAGKRGLELMPINEEAYRGVFRAEDLARIYVMVGEYDKALELIQLLLKIPSRLSIKLLLLDPAWKPLWNFPKFKDVTKMASL